MATLDKAEELLEQLRGASFDAASRDLADVQEFAKEQGCADTLQQVGCCGGAPHRAGGPAVEQPLPANAVRPPLC